MTAKEGEGKQMIRFGFFYIKGEMVIYDLTVDTTQGYTAYVATLSANTAIAYKAVRPETAIERLRDYLEHGTSQPTLARVTWTPTRVAPGEVKLPARGVAAHPH